MGTEVKAGIKETEEALVGLNELSLFMATRFKDGVQVADFTAFWEKFKDDADFKAKLEAAYEGWNKISGELADIDLKEGLTLATTQIEYIPKFLEAMKK